MLRACGAVARLLGQASGRKASVQGSSAHSETCNAGGSSDPTDSRVEVGNGISRDPRAALQTKIDTALASAQPVKIPRTLSDPHPLIRNWIDEDRRARERAPGSIYSVVPVSVTRTETDRRRLRILSGLFREFERIGYGVTAERQRGRTITIQSSSASMNFVLKEPFKRVRIPLTEKEKKDSWNQGRDWKYENQPTRELHLRIESYLVTGERTVWRDKAETRLEDRVDEILEGLLTAMAVIEDNERKRREEERRRWKLEQERAERERQRKIEVARWRHLFDLAEARKTSLTTLSTIGIEVTPGDLIVFSDHPPSFVCGPHKLLDSQAAPIQKAVVGKSVRDALHDLAAVPCSTAPPKALLQLTPLMTAGDSCRADHSRSGNHYSRRSFHFDRA